MADAEGVLKLENHNFVTILLKIGSGQSHRWMLNLEGNLDEKLAISMALKCLPTDCLSVIGRKLNSNYLVENSETT